MEAKGQVLKQGDQSVLWVWGLPPSGLGCSWPLKADGAPAGFWGLWFRGVRDPGGEQRG